MEKKKYSWGLIITMLCIFFPVGIALLLKRIRTEKDRHIQNGKGLKIAGIILLCMIPVYVILGVTGQLEAGDGISAMGTVLVVDFVLAICGVFLLVKGNQYVTRGQRYSDCASAIAAGRTVALEPLAADLRLTFDEVAGDIQWLIKSGYILSA